MGVFDRKGRTGGQTESRQSVVFISNRIVAADPRKSRDAKANIDTDHFEGVLLFDRLGLKAEFDDAFLPITPVKVFQTKDEKAAAPGGFSRPTIFSRQQKTGFAAALKQGGVVLIENARIAERNGEKVIEGDWFKVLSSEPYDSERQFPCTNWIRVKNEVATNPQSTYQYADMVDPTGARVVTDEASFREAAIEVMAEVQNLLPGDAGLMLRVIDVENKAAASVNLYAVWKGDAEPPRNMTAEEVIDGFLASDAGRDYMGDMDKGYLFEVMPASRIRTGKSSLPTVVQASKKVGTPDDYDDSIRFNTYTVTREKDGQSRTFNNTGYVKADVFAIRHVDEVGSSPWSRIFTKPSGENREIRGIHEVPSPNLPAEVAEAFAQRGRDNGKSHAEFVKSRKPAAPAAEQGAAADQEMGGPGLGR
jgi:hypothetical protein